MKRILSFAAAVMMTASMASAQDLVILHVNDTHSHLEPLREKVAGQGIGGAIERAAYVDSVRAADGRRNVLLLHAGDFSQGTSYFTRLHGDIEVDIINAMKYDVITLGNHEFDNGIEELARRMKNVKCPVVCANYDFSSFELGKYIRPYTVIRRGGLKIGIFGLLTDITRVVPRETSDRIPKFDTIETANKWADWLKNKEHCDLVIALTHIGFAGAGITDPQLVENSHNIDIVVGGHSHTFLDKVEYRTDLDGRKVPIVQDGCWGLNVGELDVYKK